MQDLRLLEPKNISLKKKQARALEHNEIEDDAHNGF